MEVKFKVKIGDIEIELTEKEIKELYAKLDEMFGIKNTYIPYREPICPNYPWLPYTWVSTGTITGTNAEPDRDINVYAVD